MVDIGKSSWGSHLKEVKAIAIEAGSTILKCFKLESISVSQKADTSPLTEADLKANSYIVEHLNTLDPTIPVLAEESLIPDYEVRKNWARFWLVDPLDGTKEFLNGSEEFTVNIALIENFEPVLGVIYAPAKELLYYAAKGAGSWKQQGTNPPQRIFSSQPDLSRPLVVVESKSHPSLELEKFLKNFKIKKRICAGSSLKFCLVAEGSADIYPRMNPTMEWDVAAGDCIYRNSVKEGMRPSSLSYNKPTLRNDSFIIGLKFEEKEGYYGR